MGQNVDQMLPEYREIRLIIGDARAGPGGSLTPEKVHGMRSV